MVEYNRLISEQSAPAERKGWRAGRIEGIKKRENAERRKRGGRLNMHSTPSKELSCFWRGSVVYECVCTPEGAFAMM